METIGDGGEKADAEAMRGQLEAFNAQMSEAVRQSQRGVKE